jgi:hypothetical protein
MLAGVLLMVTMITRLFPETPLAHWLHRWFVERPLARLATMERRHAICAIVLIAVALGASDLVLMLGSSDLVLAATWDFSLYVDTLIAAWTIAAVARGKTAWKTLLVQKIQRRGRPRARSRRSVRPRSSSTANDEDGPGRVMAIAA